MSYLAALATGLLMWTSFPPLELGWVALVAALQLLLLALWPRPRSGSPGLAAPRPAWWRATRAPGAFLHGYVAGVVFFLLNLKWLWHVTVLGAVMLALYLALYPAVWALFTATVARPRRWDSNREVLRGIVLTAAAWTGLEWVRGIALTGFGWNGLGVALIGDNGLPDLAQWAEWIGVTGLSFVVTLCSAALLALWRIHQHHGLGARTRRHAVRLAKWAAAGVSAVIVLAGIGHFRGKAVLAAAADSPPLIVALVQPNIPQEDKNSYDMFGLIAHALARQTQDAFAADPKPDILVWPESSLPAPYYDEDVQDLLRQGTELGDFTHVLGADDQQLDAYFNSIGVFRGDPLQAVLHHKVHLVPFGEYLPARGLFGKFEYIRAQLPGDFRPGDSADPLPLPQPFSPAAAAHAAAPRVSDLTLIPLICFEDTIGRVARRFVRPEPQIIVNVTNDAWFHDSEGADQHLANARFRAIELRRPMIRAANTGVTAVIDTLGRVTHQIPRLQEGHLKAPLPYPSHRGLTLYARVGDLFSQFLLALAAAAALRTTWSRFRSRATWHARVRCRAGRSSKDSP